MSFKRNFNTLIVKSNNLKSELSYSSNGIKLHNYDLNNNLISKGKVFNSSNSFSKSFFNVDFSDNIYGVIYTKENSLVYVYITKNYIYKSKIMDINKKYSIAFPYIKKIDEQIHIFYYLIDNKNPTKCKLINYFFDGFKWNENIISEISYFILSNFVVMWHNNIPFLFFFNRINGCEELFYVTFNNETLSFKEKIQITNSHKNKVYLSIIEPLKNHYHITFSENNNDKYYCSYVYLCKNNEKISIKENLNISKTVACEFPTIFMIDDNLYIQWLEFNELFTSYSKNNGKTWSSPKFFNNPKDEVIVGYNYKSNFLNDNIYLYNMFSYNKSYYPLGISKGGF